MTMASCEPTSPWASQTQSKYSRFVLPVLLLCSLCCIVLWEGE